MKRILFGFAFMCGFLLATHAQKMTVENVYKASPRNAAAIKQGSDVKGYYFFFISDKIDKKTNEYTLRITDNSLKVLKDVKFQDSKHVYILESSFNGTDLIFLFYNDGICSHTGRECIGHTNFIAVSNIRNLIKENYRCIHFF